jgi:hypothetical protein
MGLTDFKFQKTDRIPSSENEVNPRLRQNAERAAVATLSFNFQQKQPLP